MVNRLVLCCLLLMIGWTSVWAAEKNILQDPLRPARYQASTSNPVAVEYAASKQQDWHLSAVLISAQRAVAVINGQSLQVGDRLGGYQLIKIEATKVLLRNKQKQLVLHRSGTGLKKTSSGEDIVKGSHP